MPRTECERPGGARKLSQTTLKRSLALRHSPRRLLNLAQRRGSGGTHSEDSNSSRDALASRNHSVGVVNRDGSNPGFELIVRTNSSDVGGGSVQARSSSGDVAVETPLRPVGGTVCQCICGDRIIWGREIFEGDQVKEKERLCSDVICPKVTIPGLRVRSECSYVKDVAELAEGTLCFCRCGDKVAWRNRGFYGDVVKEKERECLEELCPRVSPVPGLRFEVECRFDRQLFAKYTPISHQSSQQTTPPPALPPVKNGALRWSAGGAAIGVMAAMSL